MKENKNCKIVQDLLPNYIDKLTNDETNSFIEEHLKECQGCQKILENMKRGLELDSKKLDENEIKYVKYNKKYNKKLKFLKYALGIIILTYLIIIVSRTIIMTSLSIKAQNSQANSNYYVKAYSYQGENLSIKESYNKNGDYLTILTVYSPNKETIKLTYYKKDDEKITILENGNKKQLLNSEEILGGKITPINGVSSGGIFGNLQYALIVGINSDYCNGRKCYIIRNDNYYMYLDAKTGLAIREVTKATKNEVGQQDIITDYEYKFNIVKDTDIVKPSINN